MNRKRCFNELKFIAPYEKAVIRNSKRCVKPREKPFGARLHELSAQAPFEL